MTTLNSTQLRALNTLGLVPLMDLRANGRLPDVPAVNARIAQLAYQANPANWSHGRWFLATYTHTKYRRGPVPVWVRRDDTPFGILYRVVDPSGRWCNSFTEQHAPTHLTTVRDNQGYLDDQAQATRRYNYALNL